MASASTSTSSSGRGRWSGGSCGTEVDPTQSIRLDEHRLLASWPEQNGFFITLYADFARGESSFCGSNGTVSECRSGTITHRVSAQSTAD